MQKRLEHEPSTFYFVSGYIKLTTTEASTKLYEMFVASTAYAVEFRKNIRTYNSIFDFTSFVVNLDKELTSARNECTRSRHKVKLITIYCHRWRVITIHVTSNYTSLILTRVDLHVIKVEWRILLNQIAKNIKHVMEENSYVQIFHQLNDQPRFHNFWLCIAATASLDQQVYNTRSVNQSATTWIDRNNSNIPFDREIITHEHSWYKHSKTLSLLLRPSSLLFPKGEGECQ